MSFHKAACAARGASFEGEYLGVWPYRLIGLVVVWPVVLFVLGVGSLGGAFAGLATVALAAVVCLTIWARVSERGS